MTSVGEMRVPIECVPDPEVPGCADVVVSVEVDGRAMRAVLDTGVLGTLLIDLPSSARPVGSRETSGLFGTEVVTEWEVSDVRIGALRADVLTVGRIDGGSGRQSVVGLDLLSTGPWQLDLSSRTLLTGEPLLRGVAYRPTRHGRILTEMRWPTATATALWDTGAGITLIDRRFADAHPSLFEHAGSTRTTDIVGSQGDLELAHISGYEIDGNPFAGHIVAIADLPEIPDHIDAAIGFPTISQARWTVDMPSHRWRIGL